MTCVSQKALSIIVLLAGSVLAASYTQADAHIGSGFLDAFSFEAIDDPTHGRV
jgi:hypothetical protein